MSNPFEPKAYGLQKDGKIYCFMVNPYLPDTVCMVTFVLNRETGVWEIHYRHHMTVPVLRKSYMEFFGLGYRKRDMIEDPVNSAEKTRVDQFARYYGCADWNEFEEKYTPMMA